MKKVKNAQDLEKRLNQSGGLNNLDLNEDGNVDFIHVTEYGDDRAKGFSLTVKPAPGEVQEVATIEIEKTSGQADVAIRGNSHIYGHNHHYHYRSSLTDFLILNYLFSSHTPYYSRWDYGRYPRSYYSYRPVPSRTYNMRTREVNRTSTALKRSTTSSSRLKSPNAGKTANKGIRAPLKNPTTSQKSFQARNPSKTVRSGGFGRSKSSSTSSKKSSRPSVRSSSSRRSGGISGGK